MKLAILLGIFFIVACVSGASIPDTRNESAKKLEDSDESDRNQENLLDMETATETAKLGLVRHRRVTCDVLSFQSKVLSINHSACAVRCLSLRRKGGSCKNGICVCRN